MDHLLLLDTFFGFELSTILLINKYMQAFHCLSDYLVTSILQC